MLFNLYFLLNKYNLFFHQVPPLFIINKKKILFVFKFKYPIFLFMHLYQKLPKEVDKVSY